MIVIRSRLDERRKEFLAYVRLLRHLEDRLQPNLARTRRIGDLPTNDTFKAMKATAFLMLYNVIEATIVGAMAELYKTIEREGCKLPDVSEKVQDLWIDQRFWISPHEAKPATYRKRAAQMLRETMEGTRLILDPKQLPLSGNIDGQIVRDLCEKHGCKLRIHYRARGGAELGTVKAQRNDLAHGNKTFVECGRDYGVSDIGRIAGECFNFLGGFIRSVGRFVDAGGYRAKPVCSASSFA